MPANFSNLQIRYSRPNPTPDPGDPVGPLNIDLKLSSLNFDINHATIGEDTPFTSELSFVLKFAADPNSQFENTSELAELLDVYFDNPALTATDDVGKITSVIQGVPQGITGLTSQGVFGVGNLSLDFQDINVVTPIPVPLFSSSSYQVLASLINLGETDVFALAWQVKIKFHAAVDDLTASTVLYPALNFAGGLQALNNTNIALNDELKLNYELTFIPDATGGTLASPLGKVADELSDSILNLTNTLANNLTSTFKAQLQPAGTKFTNDLALWVLIKKGTDELSFKNYFNYIEAIFCGGDLYPVNGAIKNKAKMLDRRHSLPFMNVDAYRAVKIATEAFVMVNCMVNKGFDSKDFTELKNRVDFTDGAANEVQLSEFYSAYKQGLNGGPSVLPYLAVIKRKMGDGFKDATFEQAFDQYLGYDGGKEAETCYGVITEKLESPCFLELIWSYWHEECMMVQGLNAVSRRFQNIRGMGNTDPLANLEIDPLRPLNNLLWGYIQDDQHRLTVRRRTYEYDHHYGISLKGDAAKNLRFADSRSKFIEAFHTLLNLASRFYKQADDMTVQPDGFPVLNGLRETHLILSEGAHNQYGDLPSTARAEMLMQQWLLSRPEFQQFLPSREMVAYPEEWMPRVAALNNMMSWTDTSVLHFNYLAVFGEKILLSIRFGNWADASTAPPAAANWARYWRQEIQGYIHAYRAVTGVDLSAEGLAAGQRVDAQAPSVHLFRRLTEQQRRTRKAA